MSSIAVLLIEPDADNRAMYEDALGYEGLQVITTDNGADGLEMASAADVIVTELLLRGPMDGVELVGQMHARYPRAAILIVTACASSRDRTRAEQTAADVVLLKPCLPMMLADEIRRVLAEKRTSLHRGSTADQH